MPNTVYRAKLIGIQVDTDFEVVIAETFAFSIFRAEESLKAKIIADWEDCIESDINDLVTSSVLVNDGKHFLRLLEDGHYGGDLAIAVREIKIEDDK